MAYNCRRQYLQSRRLLVTHPVPSSRCRSSISSLQRLGGLPLDLNLTTRCALSSSSSFSPCCLRERQRRRRPSWYPILYDGGKCQPLSTQTGKQRPPMKQEEDNDTEKVDKAANNEKKKEFLEETSDPTAMLTWVDHYLPPTWQPYARLARMDKPIGTWLLFWPCCISTALATTAETAAGSSALPDPYLISLFAIGSIVMRGAGCTINDIWDQKYDAQVARCRTRPLAAGDVTVPQALSFLALQMTTGLVVLLSLPHTLYCFQWGVASLPLVAIYPLMKRFFPYPQLVLGLTFNWGVWMGWAAVHGSMDFGITAPLYLSCVSWTLVYDTIYGHQDKHDDAKLGLHSTSLTFGKDDAVQKQILYSLATVSGLSWLYLGQVADMAPVIYNVGVMSAYGHLLWQIHTADLNDPHNLAERFRSNHLVGALLFGSMVAGKFFA